jgi:two-component system, NarL family, invasion response regulator UvrY
MKHPRTHRDTAALPHAPSRDMNRHNTTKTIGSLKPATLPGEPIDHLTKQTAPEELGRAIKQVLTRRMYVTASLGEHISGNLSMNPARPGHYPLSAREFEVLVLMAQGQSLKHIAKSLALSIKTISTYRARLQDKLQLATTAELIRYALDHHLVG